MSKTEKSPHPLFWGGVIVLFLLALLLMAPRPGMPESGRGEVDYLWDRALARSPRNPAAAVLVSRYGFERLRPLRSYRDVAALREYAGWADRPEAAGVRQGSVEADLSANDLILIRWPAALVRADVPVLRDPLGYAVLDPGREGRVEIRVRRLPHLWSMPMLDRELGDTPVPTIYAAQAVASGVVTIYGEGFSGESMRVFTEKAEGEIFYASPQQLNARIPDGEQIALEVDGIRSEWAPIEVDHSATTADAKGSGL